MVINAHLLRAGCELEDPCPRLDHNLHFRLENDAWGHRVMHLKPHSFRWQIPDSKPPTPGWLALCLDFAPLGQWSLNVGMLQQPLESPVCSF